MAHGLFSGVEGRSGAWASAPRATASLDIFRLEKDKSRGNGQRWAEIDGRMDGQDQGVTFQG